MVRLALIDYYPFGMQMPGRKYASDLYRYGFNGKENDNEVKGDGNQQDYGFRIYDSRIGRLLSVDPLRKKFPFYSTYQFTGNNPIKYIDLDGLEPENNPQAPGANEARAIAEVTSINLSTKVSNLSENLLSRGFLKGQKLKGPISCDPTPEFITDTRGDPNNKFNMYVSTSTTLNVDESQAKEFNNYEAFVVNELMNNFVSGEGPENYEFPTNGIITNKFLQSDVLNEALENFKRGVIADGVPFQAQFAGGELVNDFVRTGSLFSSITGFVGSATITIKKTDANMLRIKIFNITSLTSGDLWKSVWDGEDQLGMWPKSYVRHPETTTPYGNISQTFNLLIPNN